MLQAATGPRRIAHLLFLLALAAVARFGLGPCLLAGLFAYLILDRTDLLLRKAGVKPFLARWSSVGLFAVVAGLLTMIFISFIRLGLERLPVLVDRVLPRLDELAASLGLPWPVDNVSDLREYILGAAKENARALTKTSGLLTRDFFQVLVGIAVAVLRFLSSGISTRNSWASAAAAANSSWTASSASWAPRSSSPPSTPRRRPSSSTAWTFLSAPS